MSLPEKHPRVRAPLKIAPPGDLSPRAAWLVLAAVALLYAGVSFAPVIFDDNEGLYAGAVREMHARHDWLVPMSNGFPRVQKPPLVYWAMLVSTTVLGENEFALRLPNALATVGWIVATRLLLRRLGGERFGTTAAAALAAMLGVWIFTHLVQPEPFLACFISLALWSAVEARGAEHPGRWHMAAWGCMALGTMSKGLHGALWPLGAVLLAALVSPRWRTSLRGFFCLRGVLLFALLTAPWYAFMALRFPGFLQAHFLNEQLGAALDTRHPPDVRQLSLLQFYAQHLLFWLPWTLLLPGAIWGARRALRLSTWAEPEKELAVLLGCWFGLVMVSVAFSTRQDYYSMSCWGAVAGFLVFPWTARQMVDVRVPRGFLLMPCLLPALAGAAALVFALWTSTPAPVGGTLAAPIARRDTFMDALGGISPALWARLVLLIYIFGTALILGGGVAAWAALRRQNFAAILILAGTMAVPVILATRGFVVMSPYFSLAAGADAINTELAVRPDTQAACEGAPNTASSLLYYLNARVHWVNAPFDNQYAQRVLGEGHDYYWDAARLRSAWAAGAPVCLIVEDDRLAYWRTQLAPAPRLLLQEGTRDVLINR